ncbi:hypothetical protein EJB05_50947, partial [Eragrostis curvula]
MGRKRKRHRKAKLPGDRAERLVDDDSTTANQAMAEPSVAGECEKASDAEEEDFRKLLEPFTRDELLDLLADACLRDPALLPRLADSAASDATHRRLFVHGLGPGATSTALAAAFAPFGALDECHAVADRADGRCRGYGFVTFRRRSDARRALTDASKRVDGRPVACQLASLGPVAPSSPHSDRKLFVGNVPERAAHDELREFFSSFGEIEKGPLGADSTTGMFRGHAIFFYKTPEGLRKALEGPNKVFDGCELQCRRAHRVAKRNHDAAASADMSNGPGVQLKDLALTSGMPMLSSNPPVGLTAKGSSSPSATALFRQNAAAGRAGILGAPPAAIAMPCSLGKRTSSTPPSNSGAAFGHGELSAPAGAGASHMAPTTIGANNSVSSLQIQGSGVVVSSCLSSWGASTSLSQTGQVFTVPGLIQHYLGR